MHETLLYYFFILRVWGHGGVIQKKIKKLFHWTYIRIACKLFVHIRTYSHSLFFMIWDTHGHEKVDFYAQKTAMIVWVSLLTYHRFTSLNFFLFLGLQGFKTSPREIKRENTRFISFRLESLKSKKKKKIQWGEAMIG
jgi:hypothetical protein